ncbi:F-box/WD repeat-containing protein 9 [Orchesella cincta]|uniref:F-box/WD repeat-containing protein 9 n=1 Tax=Orchesella cincta TaxID=48709 RepID=A0A1D2MRA7_ORCCI|nr:F-box/WD repeat-containing protein 9 [Orchesella cincta]
MEAEHGEPVVELNLDTIPVEVLLQIFNYVDATDLLRRVALVSKYFHNILSNSMTWKIKQEKRWGGSGDRKYPPVDLFADDTEQPEYYASNFTNSSFPWARACVKREEQIKLWATNPSNPRMVHKSMNSHIGCIDSVYLFMRNDKMLLACGSRDRNVSIWSVDDLLSGDKPISDAKLKHLTAAHEGWIWDFSMSSNSLFSCSWDTSVKNWDLETYTCKGVYKTKSALLSISSSNDLLAIGAFNRKVTVLDARESLNNTKPIHVYSPHTKSILSVGLDSNYVISCGEDGSCVKHDLRSKSTVSSFKLPKSEKPVYPTCMSFRETTINLPYFYVGDNVGGVHLVDLLKFEIVRSSKLHNAPVRGVFHNLGSVVSCSKDGKLQIRDPSLALNEIGSVDVGDKIDLPCVHSLNNALVCGDGDGVVRVWGENP